MRKASCEREGMQCYQSMQSCIMEQGAPQCTAANIATKVPKHSANASTTLLRQATLTLRLCRAAWLGAGIAAYSSPHTAISTAACCSSPAAPAACPAFQACTGEEQLQSAERRMGKAPGKQARHPQAQLHIIPPGGTLKTAQLTCSASHSSCACRPSCCTKKASAPTARMRLTSASNRRASSELRAACAWLLLGAEAPAGSASSAAGCAGWGGGES